jgi:hypothetical protein
VFSMTSVQRTSEMESFESDKNRSEIESGGCLSLTVQLLY